MKVLKESDIRKIIRKELLEIFGLDTSVQRLKVRAVYGSSYGDARIDAMENGKAYFVQPDGPIIVFSKSPNGQMTQTPLPSLTPYEAEQNDDGNVHYTGEN